MKVRLPPRLNATTEEARYINMIIEALETMTLHAGPGIKFKQGTRGTVIESAPQRQGGGPVESDFRGDWNPNTSYVAGEMVVIRGGISAGLYFCHTDAAAGSAAPSPSDNTYWTNMYPANGLGYWQ